MDSTETIRVAVIFGPGGTIKPVWFDRRNRKHTILETSYTWEDRKGEQTRLHFTVRDSGGLHELIYSTMSRTWELADVECHD